MLVSLTGIIPPARHAPKRKYVDAEPTLLVGSYSLTSAHLRRRADVCNGESGRQGASYVVAYFSINLSVPLNESSKAMSALPISKSISAFARMRSACVDFGSGPTPFCST